jgi:hypothetical protein
MPGAHIRAFLTPRGQARKARPKLKPTGKVPTRVKDRSELSRVEFFKTRVRLTKDLTVMNPALVEGAQGLVVGKLANYTLKVRFPAVTVGVNWQDCEIVEGVYGMPEGSPGPVHPILRKKVSSPEGTVDGASDPPGEPEG